MKDTQVKDDFKATAFQKLAIGDIVIANLSSADRERFERRPRPCFVWGKYWDSNNQPAGLDLFQLHGDSISSPKAYLPMEGRDYKGDGENTRSNLINTARLMTVGLSNIDLRRGAVESVKEKLIPDIIARRALALSFKSSSDNITLPYGDYEREGIFFNTDFYKDCASAASRMDVAERTETETDQHALITQNDIDAITQWSLKAHVLSASNAEIEKILTPQKGTWPRWRAIPIIGTDDKIICHSPRRMERIKALQKAIAPKPKGC